MTDVETMSTMTYSNTAYGPSVTDSDGGRWWPDAAASAEITASDDPAAHALHMCITDPMRGEWAC